MALLRQSPNLVPRLKQRSVQNRLKVSKEQQRASVVIKAPTLPGFCLGNRKEAGTHRCQDH